MPAQSRAGLCRGGMGVGHWGGGLGQGWRGPDDPGQKLAFIQRALGSLPAGLSTRAIRSESCFRKVMLAVGCGGGPTWRWWWGVGGREGLWLLVEMRAGGREQGDSKEGWKEGPFWKHFMEDRLWGMNAREDDAWVSGLSNGRAMRPFIEVGAKQSQ